MYILRDCLKYILFLKKVLERFIYYIKFSIISRFFRKDIRNIEDVIFVKINYKFLCLKKFINIYV